MATRNPSLYDWNRTNSAGGGFADAFQGYRSPQEVAQLNAPLSDDQLLLLMNGKNSNRTRALRTAGDLQRAQEEAQFLDSIQPQDTAGIYSAPTDQRSAALQSILNRDYAARERGSALSMQAELDNLKTLKDWMPLIQSRQKMNQDVSQDQFHNALSRDQFRQNTEDRAQTRQLRQQQIDANQEYQNARLGQFDQSLANRAENQQANRAQRAEQAAIVNGRAQSTQVRNRFNDALNAARRGAALPQLDAAFTALMPDLSPDQQQIALATLEERAQRGTTAGMAAEGANQLLASNIRRATEQGLGFQDAVATTMQQINRNPTARGSVIYNPSLRRMVPQAQFSQPRPALLDRGNSNSVPQAFGMPVNVPQTQSAFADENIADSFAPQTAPVQQRGGDAIPVPSNRQGQYQEGRVYNVNGIPYRYQGGFMVR